MAPRYSSAIVATRDATQQPPPPAGLKYTNLVEPHGLAIDLKRYPVLLFGGFTYWALSHDDHSNWLGICAFTPSRQLAHLWSRCGARYISRIDIHPSAETHASGTSVVFTGQAGDIIAIALGELVVPPTIRRLPHTLGPSLPPCTGVRRDSLPANPALTPMLELGPFGFWAASYTRGDDTAALVVSDAQNVVLRIISCPGVCSIQHIAIDDGLENAPTSPRTSSRTWALLTDRDDGPTSAHSSRVRLVGTSGRVAFVPVSELALTFRVEYTITADDILLLAPLLKLPVMVPEAARLARRIGTLDAATLLAHPPGGPASPTLPAIGPATTVGGMLGLIAGAFAGLMLIGADGVTAGARLGLAAGSSVGDPYDAHEERKMRDAESAETPLGRLEACECVVSCVLGPPPRASPLGMLPYECRLLRFADLPYAAVLARPRRDARAPLAYSLVMDAIGPLPRDTRCAPRAAADGRTVLKYLFVLVETPAGGQREKQRGPSVPPAGPTPLHVQMRIHPEAFWPDVPLAGADPGDCAPAAMWGALRFYALAPMHAVVRAAGALYVDARTGEMAGLDTRASRVFRAAEPGNVGDARACLQALGYDVRGIRVGAEVWRWLGTAL